MSDYVEACPVVIDLGSGFIKVGFAGEEIPRVVFPSVVGIPKHKDVKVGMRQKDRFIGNETLNMSGVLKLKDPIHNGFLIDLDGVEDLIQYAFLKELGCGSEEQPILVVEPTRNVRERREKLTQMLFESFDAPSIYLFNHALAALYAKNLTTGIVLNIGDGGCCVTPVDNGQALNAGTLSQYLSGSNLTEYLIQLLAQKGHLFTTDPERKIVNDIKENVGEVLLDIGQAVSYQDVRYELPDGGMIVIGEERFRCPEALFQPQLLNMPDCLGIHQLIYESIMRCDMGIREELYANIVLSGGGTMFPGIAERLQKEITALAPQGTKVNVIASSDRQYLTWKGGAIFSSLSTFESFTINKQQYEESGPAIVHRICSGLPDFS